MKSITRLMSLATMKSREINPLITDNYSLDFGVVEGVVEGVEEVVGPGGVEVGLDSVFFAWESVL